METNAAPTGVVATKAGKVYTMEEVAAHSKNAADGIWIVINGDVLDVTSFIDKHPGN